MAKLGGVSSAHGMDYLVSWNMKHIVNGDVRQAQRDPDRYGNLAVRVAGFSQKFTWNVNCLVLFDRKKWHLPLLDRRVQEYRLGLALEHPHDVDRPEIESPIREFLTEFFGVFAAIAEGQQPQWGMRLDEWFIHAFEHHVLWPVRLTAEFLWTKANQDRGFDVRLQEWMGRDQGWLFARNDPTDWRAILDRGARTLCYVFANRLIFYESCRAKFGDALDPLDVPVRLKPAELHDHFQKIFQRAVEATGDYETLFYPYEKDWASPLIFAHPDSVEAWRSVIQNLAPFNFKLIPMDVLGGIFRQLVDPEERHKFGQHFTNEDIVDVINAFCIRDAEDNAYDENGNGILHETVGAYGARYGGGKWGKYLRAPDLYFRIMEQYGDRFVPLGEIASIRFGVKSGCDAFFMPRDVSAKFLSDYTKTTWKDAPLMTHCSRAEVAAGTVKLIQAGDGTVHPVESDYLRPILHSMMSIRRPSIFPEDMGLALTIDKPKAKLKGSLVFKYLHYGETHSVTTNRKTKAAAVSQRSTCANRDPWYDIDYTRPGDLVWAKGQQYRHVVVFNQSKVTANCRLYDVTLTDPSPDAACLLAAVANSTVVAYFKTFYGRYTGTEGGFEMMAIDLNLLEVPDPRLASKPVARKLREAFAALCERDTRPMVEEDFMGCHSAERARKLAQNPVGLPSELRMTDRRALDLAAMLQHWMIHGK